MIELREWFAGGGYAGQPWLVVGKGPTFDRRHQFDLSPYRVMALNHVVTELAVDVAHVIDVDVVGDCGDALAQNAQWLLMPRYPHLRSTKTGRRLEDWFDEYPVLADFDRRGRLVWYNLSTGPPEGTSPVIGATNFSSEAVVGILARLGVKTIRSLGIDGGRSYARSFQALESSTLLANGTTAFDLQFQRIEVLVAEHGIDYRPLVPPLRIFLGTDQSQVVAHRVLEYSIRKASSVPVEVVPMLDIPHRLPRDPQNQPRTTFSFCRFMIPKLCGYEGRALYLDADMLVFGDVAELLDLDFGPHTVLCTAPAPTGAWDGHGSAYLGARSVAVMLLDCGRLPWDVDEIVGGLDDGRYTYAELLSDVCIVEPDRIADSIPPEWNDLERYNPERTKLVHFTVVPTQPWKNDDNPLSELWMAWYREAVEAGAVPPEEVEAAIAAGHVKPSLGAALRLAPSRRAVATNATLDLAVAQRRIARLEAVMEDMKASWSWRIGDAIVRAGRVPRNLLQSRRPVRNGYRSTAAGSVGREAPQPPP